MKPLGHYLKPEVWRTPEGCLIILSAAMPLAFATWMSLLNNFVVEKADFGLAEIGILQSVREIPGLLVVSALLFLLFIKERTFGLMALILLGVGVAVTGFYPSAFGLYVTTVIMSFGFHYYETVQMSLTLQWVDKERAPLSMGRQLSARSIASIIAYGMIWVIFTFFGLDYKWVYLAGGTMTILMVLFVVLAFPSYTPKEVQHKKMILRKRYWLFYALTFMGGARRQIFVAFASFMMVVKFDFSVAEITMLYLVNQAINFWLAPKIGKFISRWGERRALICEYIGLILVFSGYALVGEAWVAAVLYILDHLFFSFAIAQKSYLQKIADYKDIAATSGVSFSINHIPAVFIPVLFGHAFPDEAMWMVFAAGAGMAVVSLILAFNVPRDPRPGNEVVIGGTKPLPQAAE
ncbi:MFS transporter [Kiloniella majae]|uniref:MFS transporter n=1 Tax=Kiloniella majae TaxID=1938558 RepID=UPI000A27887C|nr:MFS transporter [Kiloniella majae]